MSLENLLFISLLKLFNFVFHRRENEKITRNNIVLIESCNFLLIHRTEANEMEKLPKIFLIKTPGRISSSPFYFFLMDKMANESISSLDRISKDGSPPYRVNFLDLLHLIIIHEKLKHDNNSRKLFNITRTENKVTVINNV